ncbi:MAG: CsbD family protein [Rhizobiaceae bacterium]|nr:CsbD family protein [Rhizobiaceae bacterium]
MNWSIVEGKWNQLKGSIQSKWGKLTDSEIEEIKGDREKMIGKIQERYGKTREAAEKEVNDWLGSI